MSHTSLASIASCFLANSTFCAAVWALFLTHALPPMGNWHKRGVGPMQSISGDLVSCPCLPISGNLAHEGCFQCKAFLASAAGPASGGGCHAVRQ
eukprot:scaffold229302_cov18-Tisochrysis_lutea.AAC.1